MKRHYPDLGSASHELCCVAILPQPIRSTTQIWVVTRHQFGLSAPVSQKSFRGETSGSLASRNIGCFLGLVKIPLQVLCSIGDGSVP